MTTITAPQLSRVFINNPLFKIEANPEINEYFIITDHSKNGPYSAEEIEELCMALQTTLVTLLDRHPAKY